MDEQYTIIRGGDNPSVQTVDATGKQDKIVIARGGDNPSEQWITQTADANVAKTSLQGQPLPAVPDPADPQFQNNVSMHNTANAYQDLTWYARQSYVDMQKKLDTDYQGRIADLESKADRKDFRTPQEEVQYKAQVAKLKYSYYQQFKEQSARNTLELKTREFDKIATERSAAVMQDPTLVDSVKEELAARARALVAVNGDPYGVMNRLKNNNMSLDTAALKALDEQDPFAAKKYFDERKETYRADYGDAFVIPEEDKLQRSVEAATKTLASGFEQARKDLTVGKMTPQVEEIIARMRDTPLDTMSKTLQTTVDHYNRTIDMTIPQLQKVVQDNSKPSDLRQFANDRLDAFKKDPHGTLQNMGRYQPNPLNLYDAGTIQTRATEVAKLSGLYRTSIPIFSDVEKTKIGTKLAAMPTPQAAQVVSNIVKSVDPSKVLQIADEFRSNSVGAKSEIAFLSALDSRFTEYAKRFEVLPDKKKEMIDAAEPEISAALKSVGIEGNNDKANAAKEAVKVYMGGKGVEVDEAVKEMYSQVDNAYFGKAAAGIPRAADEFDEILNKVGSDRDFMLSRANGEPVFANGEAFDLMDKGLLWDSPRSDVTLKPTAKAGQFYVMHDNKFVGTKDNKKFVLNLSREINDLAVRNSR